ncbi:MAG: LysR substrate-binding domain-containing protein [Devosia sp.]
MDVRQLRYFVAVAENGSLASAANVIGIAQPSLSLQIKSLEGRLGTQLLVRSPRGVSLTDAGQVLLGHARSILEAMNCAKEEVRQAGANPTGKVIFGLPSSVSMALSVPLAETVRLVMPDVRLRAVEAMSGFIKEWIEEQSIDLGILYETGGLINAEVTTLLHEDMRFYASSDNWPLKTPPGEPVLLSDLEGIEMVMPSKSHGLRILVEKHCRMAKLNLNVVVDMDSLAQIKSLVSRASASTILAPAAAQDFEDRGELVSSLIVDPTISRPVNLVRNPKRIRTRAALEVERITREVIVDLVGRGIWPGRLAEAKQSPACASGAPQQ